jgi:hypothetical protein
MCRCRSAGSFVARRGGAALGFGVDRPVRSAYGCAAAYTGQAMRGWRQPRWTYVQGTRMVGEDGPIADSGTHWLWIERLADGGRARVWAAPKGPCCDRALASATE